MTVKNGWQRQPCMTSMRLRRQGIAWPGCGNYPCSIPSRSPMATPAHTWNGSVDSGYRFFPTMREETFGYVLHPVDLAMNKVMAAAGRREVRDLVDLVMIHETILPLGAVIWAAVEKSPGFTPEGLIAEIRRNAHYPAAEWRAVLTDDPLDPQDISARLRAALDEAEAFVAQMPTDKM